MSGQTSVRSKTNKQNNTRYNWKSWCIWENKCTKDTCCASVPKEKQTPPDLNRYSINGGTSIVLYVQRTPTSWYMITNFNKKLF